MAKLMEVYKDMGLPAAVAKKYGLAGMQGSHAIGHTPWRPKAP